MQVAVFPSGLGPLAALPERGWGLLGLGLGALPGGHLAMAVKHWRRGGEEEERGGEERRGGEDERGGEDGSVATSSLQFINCLGQETLVNKS